MIEMLGVLAIIGVLSVGGIAGYSKAMEKYRFTKLADEYSYFIAGLLQNREAFKTVSSSDIRSSVVALGIVPATWTANKITNTVTTLFDSDNNHIYTLSTRGDGKFVFEIVFEDHGGRSDNSTLNEYCQNLMNILILPNKDLFDRVDLYSDSTEYDKTFVNDEACNNDNASNCIKNLNPAKLAEVCHASFVLGFTLK